MQKGKNQLGSGSEWRKVDIHVHTPASHDYHAKGTTYKQLAAAINSSDSDIIAITDHWTLDGYRQLKPLISEDKVLLPGIEIKLDKNTKGKSGEKGGFHAQVIFPAELDLDDIEDKFLKQLELCEHKGKLPTRKDLIELGRTIAIEGASDDDCWEKGCQQAYVDFKKVVEKAHELGGLVVIPYDRHGGFEDVDPIAESVLKGDILKGTDIIETLDDDVRKAFIGHTGILKAAGKKTPAFKSSDAHEIGELGRAYTWVKGEKSFEGMRQALYFPHERVSFDEEKPVYRYPRLKSIKLTDADGEHPLTSVNGIEIPINDNLTTIIGHPSIGKSTMVEVVAHLFDSATENEIGEDVSKIENLQEINPDLKVTAEIAIGESSNTMARTLAGDYEGDIIAEEVPVTYLNQGYIDRTARDPSKVETLLKERMDTSSLEEAEEGVATVVSKLSRHRNAYLKRATLLRERTVIKGRLAAANKFFEISNSDEYKKLNERRQVLATKYSGMRSALEGVKELENVFDTYRDSVESIEIDTDVAAKLFPSLDLTKLKAIVNFPSTSLRELGQIRGAIEKSPELDGVIKEGKQLSADIAKLFEKEKISYTPKMFDEKQKELQLYQGQQRTNDAAIAAAESNEAEFTGVLDELSTRLAEREAARKVSMDDFNQGLTNVEVRYDEVGAEDWLVDVLTNGAKDAWDQYTPEEEKQVSRFRKPSEEDVRTMIATLANDERSIDEVRLHLIDCLDKDEIPTGQGHEYLKWLFGDKSVVIKDFLRLRLREYVPVGQIGLYYKEKNIAKEGLSYTERCGALLEILLEKGVEPIIIDQPEDNLGSTYITATLIPTILRKKHSRQIILISHNPNTVVLADSDLVIAFDRDGDDDGIDLHTGAIESAEIKDIICDIIEGGVDAFKLRSERYQLG